jgi:A/G-specific adenine glycosylase
MNITVELIAWYHNNKRNLPWRHTSNPYLIWLSEIILQQTRVEQGFMYYQRFVERFPKVQDLAEAEEVEVLRLWQGLGYYSRARNLHATARIISLKYNGLFPADFEQLLGLPGIGEYTAAAIASHAFALPYAVVDGNVYRFLSRLYGVEEAIDSGKGKKYFKNLAQELIDPKNPGEHNQAMMEFGALQCKPKNPDCIQCPFQEVCQAFADKKIDVLPVKKGKTKIKMRFFNYLILKDGNGKLILKKRIEKDIWQNLYDFPLVESKHEISEEELLNHLKNKTLLATSKFTISKIFPKQTHLLSHQKIQLRFILLETEAIELLNGFGRYSMKEVDKLPLPRPIEKVMQTLEF